MIMGILMGNLIEVYIMKKKLNVVFSVSAPVRAECICNDFESKEVNRSMVLRAALEIGLRELERSKIEDDKKTYHAKIRIADLRSMLSESNNV